MEHPARAAPGRRSRPGEPRRRLQGARRARPAGGFDSRRGPRRRRDRHDPGRRVLILPGHRAAPQRARAGQCPDLEARGRREAPEPAVIPLPGSAHIDVGAPESLLLRVVPRQTRMAIRAESESTRIYVAHLDVLGFTHKLDQFRALLADMAGRPPVPLTLVAGDLNTFGPVRPHLWKRISAAAEAAGLVNLTSSIHHTHWTGQKLDAIYASSHVPFSSRAWTVDARAS